MQRLEVSGVVRLIYRSLDVKGLRSSPSFRRNILPQYSRLDLPTFRNVGKLLRGDAF